MIIERSATVDFLRGLCILEMILVHSAKYFPFPVKQLVQLVFDVAAEGFILLAGLVVGWKLIPYSLKYVNSGHGKILGRALKLLFLHYLMVLSIDFPKKLFVSYELSSTNEVVVYLFDVVLLKEQPYLMDIIPMFIVMFFFTPILLTIYRRVNGTTVYILSAILFFVGLIDPYVLSSGYQVTFPTVQWQLYYIIGIFIGQYFFYEHVYVRERVFLYWFIFFSALFLMLVFLRHGGLLLPEVIKGILLVASFNISKFPITIWGLVYSCSLMYIITFISTIYVKKYRNNLLLEYSLLAMGKNALLCFILHVYFDYFIQLIDYYYNVCNSVCLTMVFFEILLLIIISCAIERLKKPFIDGSIN